MRYNWVDFSKGIGIILVVYGHVLKGLHGMKLGLSEDFYLISNKFVYSFHMPLFFFLSGFFFINSASKRTSSGFLKNKLETIAYLYIVWSIGQTIVKFFLSSFTNGDTQFYDILTCLIIPRDQFWFLFALFFINLINLCLFKYIGKLWLVLSFLLWFVWFTLDLNLSVFSSTFNSLLFFDIGILFSMNSLLFNRILVKRISLIICVVLFSFSQYVLFNTPDSFWVNLILPQILGTLLVCQIAIRLIESKIANSIEYLGINSLSIYLVHILAGSGIRIVLTNIFHIHNVLIHILLGVFLGIYLSLIFYNFSIKTKILSWLFVFPFNKGMFNKLPRKINFVS